MSDNTWDQESSLAFMEGYKNEEILWNNKHPLHKDREKMNEAWERLSEEFGKPVAELKKKKDNMLTIYNRNKRQECKTQNFISNWFAFKVMNSFLGERRAQKESASVKHRNSPIIEVWFFDKYILFNYIYRSYISRRIMYQSQKTTLKCPKCL